MFVSVYWFRLIVVYCYSQFHRTNVMLQGMGCLSWYAFLVASILSNELHHVNYLARYVNVFFLCVYVYVYILFFWVFTSLYRGCFWLDHDICSNFHIRYLPIRLSWSWATFFLQNLRFVSTISSMSNEPVYYFLNHIQCHWILTRINAKYIVFATYWLVESLQYHLYMHQTQFAFLCCSFSFFWSHICGRKKEFPMITPKKGISLSVSSKFFALPLCLTFPC